LPNPSGLIRSQRHPIAYEKFFIYLNTPDNGDGIVVFLIDKPFGVLFYLNTPESRGMVTGSKAKLVGSGSTYLYRVNFYDDKARTVQLQSTNITGDSTIVTTQYSFTNQLLFTITREGKAGNNSQMCIALTQISYDSIGRVVKTEKKISNSKVNAGAMPFSWKTICKVNMMRLAY
jgi:hypothetical protein